MKEKDKKYIKEVIDVKGILKIFRKRKWCFTAAFLVILILGLLFTFFVARDFQYKASTSITLSDDNLRMHRTISDNYPQEAKDLWLFNEGKITSQYFKNHLYLITSTIESEEFLEKVIKELNIDIETTELSQLIHIEKTMDGNGLTISNFFSNPDDAMEINQTLIGIYIDQREENFRNAYNHLISRVEEDIMILGQELDDLSLEAEEYAINFNKDIIANINAEKKANIVLETSGFLPPNLENEIDTTTERYNTLNEILNNLKDTEKLYIERIEIISGPEVYPNFNYLRNILISIVAAIAIGVMLVYLVDFIASVRNKNS